MKPFIHKAGSVLGTTPGRAVVLSLVVLGTTLLFTSPAYQYDLYLYDTVLLACIGAIALNILMGTLGQISVGSAGFLAFGAFGVVGLQRAGVSFPGDIIGATVLAGLAGAVFALPAYKLRGIALTLASVSGLFVAFFSVLLYEQAYGTDAGFSLEPAFAERTLYDASVAWAWTLWAVVSVVIVIALLLTRGRTGRALRMIRDHEVAAPAFGINVGRYKTTMFVVTSAITGFQGALTAYFLGSVAAADFTLLLSIQYVAMVIIGGLDSIPGAMVGAAIVVSMPVTLPALLDRFSSESAALSYGPQYAQIGYGLLIIIFVTTAAGGIAGLVRRLWGRLPLGSIGS